MQKEAIWGVNQALFILAWIKGHLSPPIPKLLQMVNFLIKMYLIRLEKDSNRQIAICIHLAKLVEMPVPFFVVRSKLT